MRKLIINISVIILLLFSACGHYAFIINYLNCIFYGECSDFYYTGGTQTVQLTAYGENNGSSLEGAWENKNADNSYILTFENDGKLNVALYKENELERYDLGKYSIDADNLVMEMENGTYSVVKYSISNMTLTLSMQKEQESIKTVE